MTHRILLLLALLASATAAHAQTTPGQDAPSCQTEDGDTTGCTAGVNLDP